MGAQFTSSEINAAIARLMCEEHLRTVPDYINNPDDEQRFLAAAEKVVEEMGDDTLEHYQMLQVGCSGNKVVAMVALLRLME